MGARQLDRRHPLGDGRPHERVTEPQAVGEDVGRGERGRGLARSLGVEARQAGGDVEIAVVAEHRDGLRQRAGRRAQRGDAPGHAPADPLGSGALVRRAAGLFELGQHLLHE